MNIKYFFSFFFKTGKESKFSLTKDRSLFSLAVSVVFYNLIKWIFINRIEEKKNWNRRWPLHLYRKKNKKHKQKWNSPFKFICLIILSVMFYDYYHNFGIIVWRFDLNRSVDWLLCSPHFNISQKPTRL